MKKQVKVVVSVFTDGEKILAEKRILENFTGEQLLIPGGTVKDFETAEQALVREVFEELGLTVLEFEILPLDKEIRGLKNQLIIPFLIKKWNGEFPQKILDKGNSIEWLNIDEVLNSPIEPTRKVVEALKKYLPKK